MARRTRSLAGAGKIPDIGTDNLLTPRKPLGPIGKVAKKGFKVSGTKAAKKFPQQAG